jgi:hypothetical protein
MEHGEVGAAATLLSVASLAERARGYAGSVYLAAFFGDLDDCFPDISESSASSEPLYCRNLLISDAQKVKSS